LQASGLRLATFPVGDVAFAAYVQTCWSELNTKQRDEPQELQHLVRRWHTRALVVPQSPLAALRQGSLWYVFRDGRGGGVPPESEWWTAPGTACVTFDADLVITHADDAACALAGVEPGGLVGRRWSELVPPQAPRHGVAEGGPVARRCDLLGLRPAAAGRRLPGHRVPRRSAVRDVLAPADRAATGAGARGVDDPDLQRGSAETASSFRCVHSRGRPGRQP